MADFFSHLGVGFLLSAHVESPKLKTSVLIASILPDLGELRLWQYAASTAHRLFQNRRERKQKRRQWKLGRRRLHPIKKTIIFFQHLYSKFHERAKIPKETFFYYNALHNIFFPLLVLVGGLLAPNSSLRQCILVAAYALFIHHVVDYFTHAGKWAIRPFWPLLPDWKIWVPGQRDWWKLSYPKLIPTFTLLLAIPYACLSYIYPTRFLYLLF